MSVPAEDRPAAEPAGLLFDRLALLAILAALVLAAWNGQVVIVIVLALVLAAAGLAWLWSRYSLASVTAERTLSEHRIFPGESIELQLRLANRKLLPLPWIELDDEMSTGLNPDTPLAPGYRPGYGRLSRTASLLWYTSVGWKHRLYGKRRGYYTLGPLTLTSGDIFGFYPRYLTRAATDHVIVYPKIFPIARLGIPPLYPIGETTAEKRIFEDPVRVIGVRDYTPQDSLRHIHWKASARHQRLQVKVFEPTTTLTVALFVAVDSFRRGGPRDEDVFELGISTAASVASHLIERHSSVGLYVNSKLADTARPVEMMPGSSTEQLVAVLEALAKVTPEASSPFVDFLQSGMTGLPWGTTLLCVVSGQSPQLADLFNGLKESGKRLTVLYVGGAADSAGAPDPAWHYIRRPEDFAAVDTGGTP
ncbi:MAG: DUF58 domain-containing protein [Chloroflexota bacterium]